jgi:hypothetical protein
VLFFVQFREATPAKTRAKENARLLEPGAKRGIDGAISDGPGGGANRYARAN